MNIIQIESESLGFSSYFLAREFDPTAASTTEAELTEGLLANTVLVQQDMRRQLHAAVGWVALL